MRTPSRVATASAGAMALTMFLAMVVPAVAWSTHSANSILFFLVEAVLGSLSMAALVWIGAYFGARLSAPHERSDRLIRLLSLTFVVLGIVVSLPIRTHAVVIALPAESGAGTSFGVLLSPVGILIISIAIPFLLTRALAVALGRTATK